MWQIRKEEIKNLFYLTIWKYLNNGVPELPDMKIHVKRYKIIYERLINQWILMK